MPNIGRACIALVLTVSAGSSAQTQPGQSFDVASVKPNASTGPLISRLMPTLRPGGQVLAVNVPPRDLIRIAFSLDDNQIVGGPAWIGQDGFDIDARTRSDASADQARAMLRTLLVDRFALQAHTETRQRPIYALTNTSGSRASRLRAAGPQCTRPRLPAGVDAPDAPPPPAGPAAIPLGSATVAFTCPTLLLPGYISARSITMDALAASLARIVRRTVVNRTGLSGAYDFDLLYAPEFDNALPVAEAVNAPSLFTGLRDELGLQLNAGEGPVDVLVIDGIDRPTVN